MIALVTLISTKRILIGVVFLALATVIVMFVRNQQVFSIRSETEKSLPFVRAEPSQISKPVRPEGGYIGSKACSECHSEIAERYTRSSMGRSLAKVNEVAEPLEDYETRTFFERGSRTYQIEKNEGHVWHHEMMSDAEGLIYDQKEEIQFAMGSNTRGRSYLLWRDGAMFMSPISWYAKNGWDLSPAYLPDRNLRFSRRITDACLICHSGRTTKNADREHYFPDPVFHEIAIGCERCHGPGEGHVTFRRQAEPSGPDPILDLAQLNPVERDAVCYQCHLQGEERILRYGRSEDDFRPGMKFSDVWISFLKGDDAAGSTPAVSQATQMKSSRCYQSSAARLGCVSCHEPHESPDRDRQSEHYKQRCLNCHQDHGCSLASDQQQAAPANGSCIHCHMPLLNASNIPHTSQTDHRIPRQPSRRKNSTSESSSPTFEEDGANIPEIERIRAEGLMKSLIAEKRRDRNLAEQSLRLLKKSLAVIPDDEAVEQALGGALSVLGRTQELETTSKALIERFPLNEVALQRLANAAHDAGRYTEADQLFARFVKLDPWPAVTHGRWAHTLGQLNRFDEAYAEAERALTLDPSILPLYSWLAEAHAVRGHIDKSRYYQHMAERLTKRLTQGNPRK